MKQRTIQLLSAVAVSCVLMFACSKESADPSLIAEAHNGNGNGNGGGTSTPTVSTRTCYLGQGFWFGSGKRKWPDLNGAATGVITIGGVSYTQAEAWAIWKSPNAGGMRDAKKAFILLARQQLSGNNVPTYTNMSADIAIVSNWLSAFGTLSTTLPSTRMPSEVKTAYNRLKDWMESHECDDDSDGDDEDDETCTTDMSNWFGDDAQTWPDVNGAAAGNLTIGGFTYTEAEARVVWNSYVVNNKNYDPQRVFLFLSALRLAQPTFTTYSGFAADVTLLETWLATFGKLTVTNNPTTAMPTNIADAYNRLTEWIDDNDCDD